jgi:predicted Zn-dependent peptidase
MGLTRSVSGVSVALVGVIGLGAVAPSARPRLQSRDEVTRFETERGVRVVVRPELDAEFVAISAAIRTSAAEERAAPGLGGVVASALFGSNGNLSREGVARAVYFAGGSVTADWSADCTTVTCVTTPTAFRDAMWVLAQALKTADMDPETASLGVREQMSAMTRNAADPVAVGAHAVRARLCAGHPYAKPPFGTPQGLRNVARSELVTYYRTAYRPENTVVAVAGRVAVAEARRAAENNFVDYERSGPAAAGSRSPPELPELTGPSRVELRTRSSAAAVVVGYRGPALSAADQASFAVLGALIGGGKGSRLFRAVRDSLGIGYRLGADVQGLAKAGILFTFVEVDPARTNAPSLGNVERLVVGVVEGLLTRPPTDDELLRARRLASGLHAQARQRVAERALALARAELLAGGWERDDGLRGNIERATRAEVELVARTYLRNRSVAVVRPDSGTN